MYKVRLDTIYNTIYLLVDDINDPAVAEIIHQPWVKQVWTNWIDGEIEENTQYKRLIRRKDKK